MASPLFTIYLPEQLVSEANENHDFNKWYYMIRISIAKSNI